MDGELSCGTASEPGLSGEERMAPWWIPVSFKTASEIDTRWAPLDTCASLAPIYTLKASTSPNATWRCNPSRNTCITLLFACPCTGKIVSCRVHPVWERAFLDTWIPSEHSAPDACLLLQGEDDWVKLNAEQYGFYRVQYPDELWHRLTLVAARVVDDIPMLPEVEFAGLLDDARALTAAGGVPIHVLLNLTRYCVSSAESMHINGSLILWQPLSQVGED